MAERACWFVAARHVAIATRVSCFSLPNEGGLRPVQGEAAGHHNANSWPKADSEKVCFQVVQRTQYREADNGSYDSDVTA